MARIGLFGFLFWFLMAGLSAQNTHEVLAGETWYGISRQYQVPVDSLIRYNPEAKNGLQVGMRLTIPAHRRPNENGEQSKPGFVSHVVLPGETLYGLSRHYQCSLDSLIYWNPALQQGLKVGQTLQIRTKKKIQPKVDSPKGLDSLSSKAKSEEDSSPSKPPLSKKNGCTPLEKPKKSIHICLMLPFGGGLEPGVGLAASFYQGIRLAADSLSLTTSSVRFSIMDTKNPGWENRLRQGTWIRGTDTPDVVVGPLFTENFVLASKLLSPLGIPLISPFSQSQEIGVSPGITVQLTPSETSHWEELFAYLHQKYPFARFILASNANKGDSLSLAQIKGSLLKSLGKDSALFRQVPFRPTEVRAQLSGSHKTIVILTQTGELEVKNFLTGFHRTLKEKDDVLLVGRNPWLNFQILEVYYYDRLHLHVPAPYQENWMDSLGLGFRKRYRHSFGMEPNHFSRQGFELGRYVLLRWQQYGHLALGCPLEDNREEPFELRETSPGKYVNALHRIMEFQDNRYWVRFVKTSPE